MRILSTPQVLHPHIPIYSPNPSQPNAHPHNANPKTHITATAPITPHPQTQNHKLNRSKLISPPLLLLLTTPN
ncbi:hypothetical protein EYC80_008199 [Monilinia laxa]|uniref:Uncharacterized protein n=1 Tax=Monilinia laxa TaxID=61186 RepID=A0A5N6JV08_MONLA|nr:hypothetical protein EYC80_008199 [Monilinia laxa]